MKSVETVGILGLGKMGCPIAAHLVAKGFKVVGYDPLEEARNRAVALGARGAASAREAARASDLVIIVVGFDSEVEEVLFGREGVLEGARPGLIVALGSTVAPRYSTRLAARLAEKNLVLLDIPLARGEAAATAGKLLVYGAGDPESFQLCRSVFGRSEEHTSELQSPCNLVCRLLLEKKKKITITVRRKLLTYKISTTRT